MTYLTRTLLQEPYPKNLLATAVYQSPKDLSVPDELSPEMVEQLQQILSTFSEQEQQTLQLRFVERKTLDAVGECIGVKKERVRQIIQRALRKLRKPVNWNRLSCPTNT